MNFWCLGALTQWSFPNYASYQQFSYYGWLNTLTTLVFITCSPLRNCSSFGSLLLPLTTCHSHLNYHATLSTMWPSCCMLATLAQYSVWGGLDRSIWIALVVAAVDSWFLCVSWRMLFCNFVYSLALFIFNSP